VLFRSPAPGLSGKASTCPATSRAFTLLETLAAILILTILAALLVPNAGRLLAAAQEVICASHMRSIRLALDNYIQDQQGVWPQGPPPQEAGYAEFWLSALQDYGITERTWQCPVIRSWERSVGESGFSLHYIPTMFDPTPNIASRWSAQPWLIEIADAHGKGPLMAFPDGSVKPYLKVLAEQGVR
jgi:prepilin-type N-terminal cleavage/methylation domain-containing protein